MQEKGEAEAEDSESVDIWKRKAEVVVEPLKREIAAERKPGKRRNTGKRRSRGRISSRIRETMRSGETEVGTVSTKKKTSCIKERHGKRRS